MEIKIWLAHVASHHWTGNSRAPGSTVSNAVRWLAHVHSVRMIRRIR